MAFAGEFEFEYEAELEREILGLADEGEFEGLVLVPDSDRMGDLFIQRISGFDWRMTTAPSVANDPPDRPVLKLQNAGVWRIVQEIRKRTASSCIRVFITGFVDEKEADRLNSDPNKSLDILRARAIGKQISDALPATSRPAIKQWVIQRGGVDSIENSNTTLNRALNRRVEVTIGPADCGMTIPGRP
jgi:hypothetical protein